MTGDRTPTRGPTPTSDAGVARLGTILGVWAHPDDEAYLSGGLMALARDLGSRVALATATRGEHGTHDPASWPPARLARERTGELERCLRILGVDEHRWLGYADGGCADAAADEAVDHLAGLVREVRPDTVLTFAPDGITGHADHQTVSAWATEAFDRAAPADSRLLYAAYPQRRGDPWAELNDELGVFSAGYPVYTPVDRLAVDLRLEGSALSRKVEALAAQATQTAGLIEALGPDRYAAWVADEAFVERSAYRAG